MEITLKIKGEDKTFVQNFVSGYFFKEALKLSAEEEKKGFDIKMLDREIDFIVDVFGKQFSREDFYNGVDATKLMSEVRRILAHEILGVPTEDQVKDFLSQMEMSPVEAE